MKFNQVVIPHLNVNDIECTVVDLMCEDGSIIKKNDIICIIETTKASVEITSDFEGHIQFLSKKGDTLKIGQAVANVYLDKDQYENSKNENVVADVKKIISKKARALMIENNLSEDDFKEFSVISYNSVVSKLQNIKNQKTPSIILNSYKENHILLVGDKNSCIVAAEIFFENGNFHPINFISLNGDKIDGLDNANIDDLEILRKNGLTNVFLCLQKSKSSENLIEKIEDLNFNFCNCISNFSNISISAKLGKSVLIQPFSMIGPNCEIGNFTKILNKVSIAHHTKIGNFVTIADGSNIGGNVFIDDYAELGIGVNVNRRVSIGKSSTIISGMTVVDFVKENEIVRGGFTRKVSGHNVIDKI